jgi:hypothetical protein
VVLERIRFGQYRPEEMDIDAMNETFFHAMHDVWSPDAITRDLAPEPNASSGLAGSPGPSIGCALTPIR